MDSIRAIVRLGVSLVVALGLAYGGRIQASEPVLKMAASDDASALTGKRAPDFTLENMEGKQVSLASQRGSVVILDFWATWCGPCVASMPHLDRLYRDFKDEGLKVYAVNLREGKDKVQKFLDDKKLTLPALFDTEGKVAKQYGVRAIPMTVIIGKDGTVRKVQVGFNPRGNGDEAMRKLVEEELKKEAPKEQA